MRIDRRGALGGLTAGLALGDRAYMGDPPHEPRGWYGLFDSGEAMLAVVREHAAERCLGLPAACLAA